MGCSVLTFCLVWPRAARGLSYSRQCSLPTRHNQSQHRMARQVYTDRASKVQEKEEKRSRTYLPGTIQHVVKPVPKHCFLPSLKAPTVKSDCRFGLSTCPSITHTYRRTQVQRQHHFSSFSGTLVRPHLLDVVQKDEHASLGRVAKARRRRGRELAQ